MKRKTLLIPLGVVVVAALIFFNLRSDNRKRTDVHAAEVTRRDVVRVVTASGTIQPKRRVNVSASAMGKVTRVAVEEGDQVEKGDFLLQIDPTAYESAVDQLTAAVRGAEATLQLESASLKKARYDLGRSQQLHEKGFASEEALRDARVAEEVAEARVRSAEESLAQARANLKKARHELSEVRITAEMSGIITALNVEEGESAIVGTINNPGTVLLTIADLSQMEAEVEVDETEVVLIEVGQSVEVTLDAYPDTTFSGVVSEVGNSAVRSQLGLGQASVDFKVVVTIRDAIPNIRPGLSAAVEITVARAENALTVPIQCLTVRPADEKGGDAEPQDPDEKDEVEGVFVVEGDRAVFRPVRVGIAGQSHFEVVSGLSEGEMVVSGPFRAITDLDDGDLVKVKEEKED